MLFGAGLVINLLALSLIPGGFLKVFVLFTMALSVAVVSLNLFAAIKGIITLNNVHVSRAFRRNG